jgi:hypothetical protein
MMSPQTGERRIFAAWFVLAVVLSLAVHALFFERSRVWKIKGFSPESYDMIVPRTFRMKHVEIDPATLEETVKQAEEVKRETRPIDRPPEKPTASAKKTEDTATSTAVMKDPTLGTDQPVAEAIRSSEAGEPRLDSKAMKQLMEGNPKAPLLPVDPLKDLADGSGRGPGTKAYLGRAASVKAAASWG